jgi:tetratricopeptide (TPR) repeat protein
VLWHQGELEPARERLEAALSLAEAAGNRVGVAHGLNDLAGVLVALDRPADALKRLAEAYAVANELGYRRFAGVTVGNAAELFQMLGHADAALACAARSLRIAESLQDVVTVVHTAMVIAAVRRRQGEPAEAERLLGRVIDVARATDNRRYLAEAWLHRARAYRDLGRAADARHAAGEALAVASAVGQSELAAQARAFEDDAPPPPPLANPFADDSPARAGRAGPRRTRSSSARARRTPRHMTWKRERACA